MYKLFRVLRKEKKIVVCYSGGLGNQMFEYAYEQKLRHLGKDTEADVSSYLTKKTTNREFVLDNVFPNIILDKVDENEMLTYRRNKKYLISLMRALSQIRFINGMWNYDRGCLYEIPSAYKVSWGVMEGYWQSHKYFDDIADKIRQDFEFASIELHQHKSLVSQIDACESVAIHLRGGDYLDNNNFNKYGGICTLSYYRTAVKYIQEHTSSPHFFVFSNDMIWARNVMEKLDIVNVTYVDGENYPNRKDWNDLYFMTRCKHIIIANSSFSWWGAWLGTNSNRIVVAPARWINENRRNEICPDDWICV